MTRITRDAMLKKIRSNIERHGHHVYIVTGRQSPRFAYTIGVSQQAGTELVLAGAEVYSKDDVKRILDELAAEASKLADGMKVDVDSLGTFTLRTVHKSWCANLVLGAIDYYEKPDIPVLQVVPNYDHWTVDIPDLSKPHSIEHEPVWRWLTEPWQYSAPKSSTATTNLAALKGERVTEVMRWEEGEWEMFAGSGPDTPEEEMRVVPLGVLLGADPTLAVVTDLKKEKGLWRDPIDLKWRDWG